MGGGGGCWWVAMVGDCVSSGEDGGGSIESQRLVDT